MSDVLIEALETIRDAKGSANFKGIIDTYKHIAEQALAAYRKENGHE